MHRFAFVVVVLVGCGPDVCDQNVVADIASISEGKMFALSTGSAFTCAGGGSGTGTSFPPPGIWHETVTFDNCTENNGDDTLTLTGTIMLQGDTINSPINDSGDAQMFKIRGTVAGCGTVDETCTVQWGPKQDENDPEFYRSGTVCGRSFP